MSLASTKLTSSRQNRSRWQLHHVKGMRFARHSGSWCGLFEEWMGSRSAFASRLHQQNRCLGQAGRRKQRRGAEEIHSGSLSSCKRKRERLNLTELIGLPVTVASLAYWQTYTLQTLVCVFHCFACQCKPGKCMRKRNLIHDFQYANRTLTPTYFSSDAGAFSPSITSLPSVSRGEREEEEPPGKSTF